MPRQADIAADEALAGLLLLNITLLPPATVELPAVTTYALLHYYD